MSNKLLGLIKIDRRSTAPIAAQIHQSIRFLILSEKAKFKDMLPSIKQVATHLDVDVHEVTESYHLLVLDRMIRIDNNGDAFVEFYELTETIAKHAITYFEAIQAIGMKPSVECVEQGVRLVDAALALEMAATENESVFYFKRVFYGDGRPFSQIEQYVRLAAAPDFERDFNPEVATYHYYQSVGIKIATIKRLMRAVRFAKDVCERMQERRNAAGLQSRQYALDASGQVIEYSISYLRSTYYQPFTTYPEK